MATKKQAQKASSPSSAATAAPKITLSGGEAHHSSLVALWRKEKLTDIAVCAEGVEFKAHRAVLASSSDYFLSLFDSGMRDAANPTHALEGLRSPVLEALLTFVYEGSCEVEAGLLTEILDASARLVVDPLKAACAFAIQSQLAPCNALDVWRIADLYTLPALEKAAIASALGGFEELPPQSASGAQVLALVQEEWLVAKSEEAVFLWVVRYWETAQPTEAEVLAVMKHLRFAAMDAGFVQTMVQAWPGLDSKEGLARIVLDSALSAGHALPRWGFGARLVYILGGSNVSEEGLSTVDVYDPLTDAWKQLASMPAGRHLHAGAALDGNIYVMGGHPNPDVGYDDREVSLSTADVYNPRTDCWHLLANMASSRTNLAAAAADGRIYAIGGENDEGETIATVEAFDPLLGVWSEVASMSFPRYNHAAAVVDGKIYAIGGIGSEGESIDSVEMYDPQADSWQQVASMPQARFRHATAVVDGMIFVSGGYIDDFVSTAVVVFDPQTNTWTSEVASMGTARRDHASAAIGGKVYAFGGFLDEPDGSTASVEAYDPISNTWAQVLDLTNARDDFVAVAL